MTKRKLALTIGLALTMVGLTANAQNTTFDLVRSSGAEAAGCISEAAGRVTINSIGIAEVMHVEASGLPTNTDFDVFVIQVPDSPFGLSWYQGDLQTDSKGKGVADFIGRFSIETFIVAPGSATAPVVFTDTPFPDADTNPATNPVHTYHLGIWFNSSADAAAAGCPNTVTPFNGEHTAGIQALSTRNFSDHKGPLRKIK